MELNTYVRFNKDLTKNQLIWIIKMNIVNCEDMMGFSKSILVTFNHHYKFPIRLNIFDIKNLISKFIRFI